MFEGQRHLGSLMSQIELLHCVFWAKKGAIQIVTSNKSKSQTLCCYGVSSISALCKSITLFCDGSNNADLRQQMLPQRQIFQSFKGTAKEEEGTGFGLACSPGLS